MKLRLRLALTTLAVTLPMVAGLVWLDRIAQHRQARDRLAELALEIVADPAEHGRVELNALVERVLERHRPIARQLEVSLESALPERPLFTGADVTLLEQAVSNVVYNAIGHNRPSGHAAVVLEAIAGERFRLRIVDDGPGVDSDELARLIERGFRGGGARTRSRGGQGLGLYIASRVAEMHGFTLEFGRSAHGGLQVDLAGLLAAS